MKPTAAELGRRVLNYQPLDRPDVFALARAARDEWEDLIYWAGRVRRQRFARQLRLCSIVPGKLGGCSEDCKWCAQSAHHHAGPRNGLAERASDEQIAAAARETRHDGAANLGIVNSGRAPSERDLQKVISWVRRLTSDNPDRLQICASLGELSEDEARRLAEAGLTRYHHNLETSRDFYSQMVTTHGYERRIATLRAARAAGLKICCGGLFGLGETWTDRIQLALTLRDEVAPDVVPINFLQPIPGTPLEANPNIRPREALAIIAVYRLILPDADLKLAGGRHTTLRDLQSWAFDAGATSCMIGHYLTTAGRDVQTDRQMFDDLGLQIVEAFSTPDPPSAALNEPAVREDSHEQPS